MRLTDFQRKSIKDSVTEELGENANVYLFGSRIDDAQRGGDIDLMVEVSGNVTDIVRKKQKIIGSIQRKIGEQKIDLIITFQNEYNEDDLPLVIKNARREGVLL